MHKTGKTRAPNHASVALLIAVLISGCVTTNGRHTQNVNANWLFAGQPVTWLSAEHAQQLEQTPTGSIITLNQTPWGEQIRIPRTPDYFSATGAECFKSTISTSKQPAFSVNVCKYPNGHWGVSKALQATNAGLHATEGGES